MGANEQTPTVPGLEVRERIGAGGMGTVYKAYQTTLDRLVALKTVKPEFLSDDGLARFQREARLLAQCTHPNIVRILEFHPEMPAPYFLMEYVDGVPLNHALKTRPWPERARLFAEVVATVAGAHDHGIIHGDLKPSNILVNRQFQPRVLDFGLARLSRTESATFDGVSGTLSFLAPEVWDGAPTSVRSDIYALGVTLYYLMTGVMPYSNRDEARVGRARLPTECDSSAPEPLQRICLKAMERNPEDRYETAEQMQHDLEQFAAGVEIFVRPRRYQDELEGRVRNHLAEIKQWDLQGIISRRECDHLAGSYRSLMKSDSPWLSETRKLLTGPLLLRLGAWCLLLSTIMWPALYWNHLGRVARVTSTALPTLLMAGLGAAYIRRGNRRYAIACLGSFILLLFVFQVTLLSEFRLFEFRQRPDNELWGEFHKAQQKAEQRTREANPPKKVMPQPEEGDDESYEVPPADPTEFLLTNFQVFIISATAVGCLSLLLWGLKTTFFASWLVIAWIKLYVALLLLVGDKARILHGEIAWTCLHFFGVAPLLYVLGYLADWRFSTSIARPFYFGALLTGLVALGGLAVFGAKEWFHSPIEFDSNVINIWIMIYSVPFFMFAWAIDRYGTDGQRPLTWLLFPLIPAMVLIPMQLIMGNESAIVWNMNIWELVYPLACGMILLLARLLNLPSFATLALWGFSVWVIRIGFSHYLYDKNWALAVAISGLVFVALGVLRSCFERRKPRAKSSSKAQPLEFESTPMQSSQGPTITLIE